MEDRSRQYLNTVKGVAVLLMLWGHCIQYCGADTFACFDDEVFQAIYSFHMPLFMLVSGYLFYFSFSRRDLKTLLVHRVQAMAQPIIMGTILCNLLVQGIHLVMGQEVRLLNGALFSGMNLYWFLWCVLASSLAVGTACKITQRIWVQGLLLLLGAGFVALFPEMDMQLFMYPFFVAGFLWARNRQRLKKLEWLRFGALLLFPLMLPKYRFQHFIYLTPIYSPEYGFVKSMEINCFRYAIGLVGSVFVLTVVDMLLRRWHGRFAAAIAKLGEVSLQIYCLSAPLLSVFLPTAYGKVVQLLGGNVLAQNRLLFHMAGMPLLTAAYAAGLYVLVVLMKKMKIHGLIFGR